jgi:hypothetical protein
MRIAIFCRWVLGLALLELGLARPCSAQAAQIDAGPGDEVPAPAQLSANNPLELSWLSADPNCEGTTVAARAIELVTPGITPRPTQARAELSRDGNSWVVDLQTRSESHAGRRVLRGESCKEIQQAISLLLAMILESEAKSAASQASSPPATSLPSAAAPNTMLVPVVQDSAPVPPPQATPGPSVGWLLRSDATAAMGLKEPGLNLGAGIGAALSIGAVELAAGVIYWPASRAEISDGSGTIEVTRQNLTLAGCYRFSTGAVLQIVPCLGPELTWYRWHSEGIENTDGNKLSASLTGSIEFRFTIAGPMFASLTPGVTGQWIQPFRVKIDCTDCIGTAVFHTWGIGPRLGAGVGARF